MTNYLEEIKNSPFHLVSDVSLPIRHKLFAADEIWVNITFDLSLDMSCLLHHCLFFTIDYRQPRLQNIIDPHYPVPTHDLCILRERSHITSSIWGRGVY